mgnify:CR=1 FL=1
MRLLRAELARFFARRLTKVLALLLLLLLGVGATVTGLSSQRPTDAELERAQAMAAEERQRCEAERQENPDLAADPAYGWDCDDITADAFLPYLLSFEQEAVSHVLEFAIFLALFGYLVGASMLGAEWSYGGMANLLLWRPNRVSVLLGKLFATVLGVLVTGLVIGAAFIGALWLFARYRGYVGTLDQEFWLSFAGAAARGLGLAALLTVVGATIASLGRRTAAALGTILGYVVVWEIGARATFMELEAPVVDSPMLSTYFVALLSDHKAVWDAVECATAACEPAFVARWWHGALVIGGLALLTTVLAAVSMRRRDVA